MPMIGKCNGSRLGLVKYNEESLKYGRECGGVCIAAVDPSTDDVAWGISQSVAIGWGVGRPGNAETCS